MMTSLIIRWARCVDKGYLVILLLQSHYHFRVDFMMRTKHPSRRPTRSHREMCRSFSQCTRVADCSAAEPAAARVGCLAWLLKIGEWPELSSHEFAFRMLKEVLLVSVNLFF